MNEYNIGIEEIKLEYVKHHTYLLNNGFHGFKTFTEKIISMCDNFKIKYSHINGEFYINELGLEKLIISFKNREKFRTGEEKFYSAREVSDLLSKARGCNLQRGRVRKLEYAGYIKLAAIDADAKGVRRYYYRDAVDEIIECYKNTISLKEISKLHKSTSYIVGYMIKKSNLQTFIARDNKREKRISLSDYNILKVGLDNLSKRVTSIYNNSKNLMENGILDYKYKYVDMNFFKKFVTKYIYEKPINSYVTLLDYTKIYLKYNNIPYVEADNNIYVRKIDAKQFIKLYKSFNKENYYTFVQVANNEKLGVKSRSINNFIKPVVKKRKLYYPKDEIEKLIKLKQDTIRVSEIPNKFQLSIRIQSIYRAINKINTNGEKVKIIKIDEHPFKYGDLVYVKDLEKIRKSLELDIKISEFTDPYKKFLFLIMIESTNNEFIKKTNRDFCNFIIKRYNSTSEKLRLVSSHVRLYNIFQSNLKKELVEYEDDELKHIINIIQHNKNATKQDEGEFEYFLRYCNKNNKNNKNKTKFYKNGVNRSKLKKDKEAYSKNQWFSFLKLIFESVYKLEYLQKAATSRTSAMSWLYFMLHYVTIQRTTELIHLPKPDLNIIGFSKPEDFLRYIKNGGELTEDMAEAICLNIDFQMKALGKQSSKNDEPIRFVVGRTIVKQVGTLLAICEAHRQISTLQTNKNILTKSAVSKKLHIKFLGDNYTSIFGSETFSNKKASTTHIHILELEGEIYIASVLRAHALKDNVQASKTTQDIYATHGFNNSDEELEKIMIAMYERGIFSSVAYKLLFLLDVKFKKISLEKQTHFIKELDLTPYKIESMIKRVVEQKSIIDIDIDNMLINKDISTIKKILIRSINGKDSTKHNYSQCLFKSFIDVGQNLDGERFDSDINKSKCFYPSSRTCFNCQFLIAEKQFLIEFSERIEVDLLYAVKAVNKRDKQRYTELINGYKRILYEAIEVLGVKVVSQYLDLKYLLKQITYFEAQKLT